MKTKGKSGVMDMTQGNMAMLILSFALPLMLGNVFQQFYTVADTAIVGKILGVDALAALGTVEVDKLAGSGDHSGNHPGLWHPCFPAVWC